MKAFICLFFIVVASTSYGHIFGEDLEVPPVDPVEEIPVPPPPPRTDIRRVPWTAKGSNFLLEGIRQMCQQTEGRTRCEKLIPGTGELDTGYKVYETSSGKLLYVFDRAIAEEVQQDHALSQNKAEEHYPWSMYVARREAEKSDLEYMAISCRVSFGSYCGAMAAKLGKFKELIVAGCVAVSEACQKWVRDKQAEIQKDIDRVLKACGQSDQACFDAITGGGETQARAQSALEKSSGERPPHTPTGPLSPGRPTSSSMPGGVWYDESCSACTITEGQN